MRRGGTGMPAGAPPIPCFHPFSCFHPSPVLWCYMVYGAVQGPARWLETQCSGEAETDCRASPQNPSPNRTASAISWATRIITSRAGAKSFARDCSGDSSSCFFTYVKAPLGSFMHGLSMFLCGHKGTKVHCCTWKQVRFHGAWSQLLIHFDIGAPEQSG